MAQNSNQNVQPTGQTNTTAGGGNNKMLLYVGAAILIIIVIIAIVLLFSGSSGVTVTQNHSASSIPIYMSAAQVQTLTGSSVSDYSASDMYNPSSAVNISEVESAVPTLIGNVTSAWITAGAGSNSAQNVSLQYYVLQGSNPSSMASSFSSLIISSLNMTPTVVTPGTQNGLTYTYSLYENSTVTFQVLSGWKGNDAALVLIEANPGYSANVTQLVDITANDTS